MSLEVGPDLALSMQHDAVLLDDISLALIKRISHGVKHSVDADGDLILGYSTDAPTASVDVSLGQVRHVPCLLGRKEDAPQEWCNDSFGHWRR